MKNERHINTMSRPQKMKNKTKGSQDECSALLHREKSKGLEVKTLVS